MDSLCLPITEQHWGECKGTGGWDSAFQKTFHIINNPCELFCILGIDFLLFFVVLCFLLHELFNLGFHLVEEGIKLRFEVVFNFSGDAIQFCLKVICRGGVEASAVLDDAVAAVDCAVVCAD